MTEQGINILALAILCFAAANASIIPSSPVSKVGGGFEQIEFNEDGDLTTRELIEKYGYRGETHQVTTADGYILEMHRITGHNTDPSPVGKQPVLLMHGILASSADWVITGPDRAFAYLLADEGYDVWMGNIRGNTYSRKHKKHSTLTKAYWQFSWHEIGIRDIPAMIDYILDKSNKRQLIYVAHSQGTTDFWVMASERPEYQAKIKTVFALAPVAYLTHVQSPFYKVISKFGNNIGKLMSALGHYEFEPTSELVKEIKALVCHHEASTQPFCVNIIFLVAGFSSDQLNKTMLSTILGHVPAGASVKQMVHYAQVIKDRKFQQWDYGKLGNLLKYKRLHPPVYDLSKIKVPVHLHYSSSDWFASPRDVDRLYKELGNPVGKFRVPHEKFAHLDFLWANDGRPLLYDKIVGLMQKYKD